VEQYHFASYNYTSASCKFIIFYSFVWNYWLLSLSCAIGSAGSVPVPYRTSTATKLYVFFKGIGSPTPNVMFLTVKISYCEFLDASFVTTVLFFNHSLESIRYSNTYFVIMSAGSVLVLPVPCRYRKKIICFFSSRNFKECRPRIRNIPH
jgi:hypothetical protein